MAFPTATTLPTATPSTEEKPPVRAIQREIAHRAFAAEFNASRHEIKGQGEKDPSFLVSPLGAKMNRVHVVGVCTDIEPVGESGEVWRARISDPSGVFTVYAGNYQPEAAQAISQLVPPQFVAITGKARTYEPEPGTVFVSIRPESVTIVDKATRDQWNLDTARRTAERLDAVTSARADPAATAESLTGKGMPRAVAEGAMLAQQHYGLADFERYRLAARTCLTPLVGGTEMPVHRIEPRTERFGNPDGTPAATEPTPQWKPPMAAPKPDAAKEAETEALDASVAAAVQRLEGAKGARWDDILAACAVGNFTSEHIEEALNRLMDKGLVYEPTLGVLKST